MRNGEMAKWRNDEMNFALREIAKRQDGEMNFALREQVAGLPVDFLPHSSQDLVGQDAARVTAAGAPGFAPWGRLLLWR